jgi:hypothetical protein
MIPGVWLQFAAIICALSYIVHAWNSQGLSWCPEKQKMWDKSMDLNTQREIKENPNQKIKNMNCIFQKKKGVL